MAVPASWELLGTSAAAACTCLHIVAADAEVGLERGPHRALAAQLALQGGSWRGGGQRQRDAVHGQVRDEARHALCKWWC